MNMQRWTRRSLRSGLIGLGLLVLLPVSASADPPVPTNYRSTVVDSPAGIDARIVGGDSFLVIEAPRGTLVEVPGYSDEPYLRFREDGTVERNARSAATLLNESRYLTGAETDVPADNDAPPLWEVVATEGTYAWHDHRVHFMGVDLPSRLDPRGGTQLVFEWEIPITIDGEAATIHGRLDWLPDESPVLPIGIAVAGVAGIVGLAARRQGLGAVLGAAVAGVAAMVGGAWLALGLPAGATANPLDIALPVAAVVATVVAAAAMRARPVAAALLTGLAAVPAIVWAITRIGAFQRPVLPAEPAGLLRGLVALALGAGIGAVAAGLWSFLSAGVEELGRAED